MTHLISPEVLIRHNGCTYDITAKAAGVRSLGSISNWLKRPHTTPYGAYVKLIALYELANILQEWMSNNKLQSGGVDWGGCSLEDMFCNLSPSRKGVNELIARGLVKGLDITDQPGFIAYAGEFIRAQLAYEGYLAKLTIVPSGTPSAKGAPSAFEDICREITSKEVL